MSEGDTSVKTTCIRRGGWLSLPGAAYGALALRSAAGRRFLAA